MFTGIDIGGTKCAVCTGDEKGPQKKITFETTTMPETLERIINAVEELGKTDAIGISCGGPLDSKRGVIMSPPNLPDWVNVPIVKILEDKFGVPVGIQNDANACALAEWRMGAGQGCRNMIFLTFGTGLGAGLILDGKLYTGTNDMAGEVGHIRLRDDGPVGFGKKGSFEGFCSGGGIAQLGKTFAQKALEEGNSPLYCPDLTHIDEVSAKTVAEAAKQGDETAIRVYKYCGEMLGRGLSVLIDILNPEKIVIGSVFQRSGDLLREEMERVIKEEALSYSAEVCQVVPAKLSENIGDYAALAVAEATLNGTVKNVQTAKNK